jgi:hypothetical protein
MAEKMLAIACWAFAFFYAVLAPISFVVKFWHVDAMAALTACSASWCAAIMFAGYARGETP